MNLGQRNKPLAAHGDTYDYSNTIYHGTRTDVIVGCRVHGPFQIAPQMHTDRGYGCFNAPTE